MSNHVLARGATILMRNAIIAPQFQSTLPQGERQEEYYNAVQEQMISIHAPARGATDRVISLYSRFNDFNPRSRKGSDRNYNQISQLTFIQNYLFTYVIFSLLLTPSPSSKHSSIFCAIFPVRIPRIFYVYFRFAPAYKINI